MMGEIADKPDFYGLSFWLMQAKYWQQATCVVVFVDSGANFDDERGCGQARLLSKVFPVDAGGDLSRTGFFFLIWFFSCINGAVPLLCDLLSTVFVGER